MDLRAAPSRSGSREDRLKRHQVSEVAVAAEVKAAAAGSESAARTRQAPLEGAEVDDVHIVVAIAIAREQDGRRSHAGPEPTGPDFRAAGEGLFDDTIGYCQDGALVWAIRTGLGEDAVNELPVWETGSARLVRRTADPMLKSGDALSADGRTFVARTRLAEP